MFSNHKKEMTSQLIVCLKKNNNRDLSLLTAASAPLVAGGGLGPCRQAVPWVQGWACLSHGALLLPGPSPGLPGSSACVYPTNLLWGLCWGPRKTRSPVPAPKLVVGTEMVGHGAVHTGCGASSGPTSKLRVGLLGLLLPPFYTAEN